MCFEGLIRLGRPSSSHLSLSLSAMLANWNSLFAIPDLTQRSRSDFRPAVASNPSVQADRAQADSILPVRPCRRPKHYHEPGERTESARRRLRITVKITQLELETVRVNERETWVFVLIHTDAGLTGLGELNPSAPRSLCIDALRRLGRRLVGRDPRRIEALYAELRGEVSDLVGVRALSALELCLWDLRGQSLEAPIHALLGGACQDAIRLYANITRATPSRTPEAFARSAAGAVADGFTAVKLAPFAGKRPIGRIDGLEEPLECVRAVRRAVGPYVDVMLDCYGLFSAEAGLDLVEALAGVDLYWLEEPVAGDDLDGYLEVKAGCPVPLAGGEDYEFLDGFWPALERRAFDIAMPDVGVVGGICELDRVASAAESRGMRVAPHGPFGPVTLAASAQVVATHRGFLTLEYPWGLNDWRAGLVEPAECIEGSYYRLPDKPGLGVALNPTVLAAHRADRRIR